MDRNFDEALEAFRNASEEILLAHYAQQEFTFAVPSFSIGNGKKYIKIWRNSTPEGAELRRDAIHAFVEVSTGDIFKPASCKAPAKHARGNIYNNSGRDSLTVHGNVAYMR